MRLYITIILNFFSIGLFSQINIVYGTVRDSINGETLIGATVYVKEMKQGTVSNEYGFYSASLSRGNYTIVYSYIGYQSLEVKVELKSNMLKDILLSPQNMKLQEVKVTAQRARVEEVGTSENKIAINTIKAIPTITGEPDVIKSLQLLPGIQVANEGTSNLYVRGGNYDQNLIILDETPVYNPTHSLGFFSTFNSDAIKNVTVYKGAFPSQYGGRLSSVVDITMKEGNYNKMKVNAGVGLLASRLSIEAPIVKEKASFIVSGRYSYAGTTLNLFGGKIGGDALKLRSLNDFNDQNDISFYDFNAKINYKVDENNHIYLSTYTGRDHFYCYSLNNENQLEWGNLTSTLRWNHLFSGKLFSNLSTYYSNYNYNSSIKEDIRNYEWKSNIQELGLKYDFTYYPNQKNRIKTGLSSVYHYFEPGKISPKDTTSIIVPFSLDGKRSVELIGYFNNEQKITKRLTLNYGLRYTVFMNYGQATVYNYTPLMNNITDSTVYAKGEIINFYHGLEPRFSVRFKINNNNTIKLAYAYTKQYLHMLSNSSVGLPTDVWLPADSYIKPQSSHQYVLGFYRTFYQGLELTIESYYKQLHNIIDFVDNADLFMNKNVETQILAGKGWSTGIEFLLEKHSDKLTAWLGYTLAKTKYKINGINNDDDYSPRYDIRHNFTAVGIYKINNRWLLSSTFKISSGGFVTVPTQIFLVDNATFFDYPERNNYKLPIYHRLDIAATYKSKKSEEAKRCKSKWVFAINNVYNRKNVFALYLKQDDYDFLNIQSYKMYLYGIVPSIIYNLSF
ncbi:MAG: carboxypeptidase-like regulatory domain-containing protein [Bacteroidetes bacterium]|nr:carboxypeptidase-like regulatory domain-containing protein [Bacteroidota bacterium]